MRSARQQARIMSCFGTISRTSILLILGVSSDHLFTIIAARPPAATFTQSVRIHIPCVPPPRFRASVAHAHSHRYLNNALGHENDDDDDDVPSNAERRTSNVERRDARVTPSNARAHDADDATTVAVTMKATMTATVVVLRVVVHVV